MARHDKTGDPHTGDAHTGHAAHDSQLEEHAGQLHESGHAEHHDHGGHGHHGHHGHGGHDAHAHHSPQAFRDKFWISLLLTLPILYFSEQLQAWLGYEAVQFPGSGWVNPVLGTVLFFYGGTVFLRGAREELAGRQPGMMTLISLAITVAYLYSLAVTLGLPGMPFYWELATLITIMLLGHWLEMASVEGASRALDELMELVPSTARRMEDGEFVEVTVDRLRTGDLILVRPGEQVPVDGVVEQGDTSTDESFLTGESKPIAKAAGDEVVAASINGEGAVTVRVTRTGDDTTLSQMQRLVAQAQSSRSRFQVLADRAAGWLFYIALGAGILTFLVWFALTPGVEQAITRTVTVLIIACPHALGLAIPLVTVNATALSARHGILVRNREAFERARDIDVVAFDKTGTLTEGRFEVRATFVQGAGEREALQIAAALEVPSEHPLGNAIVERAQELELNIPRVSNFSVVAGKGVRGEVDGTGYTVGRPEWIGEQGLELPEALQSGLTQAEDRGESVIALMDQARVLAVFALADKVRTSAREAIRGLQEQGIETVMITGDSEAVARTVAAELGMDRYYARVLPGDKARLVGELQRDGNVAFVGDGINDAPALLQANLGIAIGAGTNIAIESADLVLVEDDPRDVLAALRLSKATYRKMIQNLGWATGYNAVAIPLAAGVLAWAGFLLSPAVGAILMSISTIVVAINATLLRRTDLTG